jgi:hypothetical protein
MTTIFGTTTNVATATGSLANSADCMAMDSLIVERMIPPDIEFNWDLKFCSFPNAFNCKRTRGNVPLTIFGSADIDVSQIDISSLRLALEDDPAMATGAPASTRPLADRGSPGDVNTADTCIWDDVNSVNVENPDGFLDLDVGFSAAEVANVACPIAKKSSSKPLIVTGTLIDGTPLEALNTQVLGN